MAKDQKVVSDLKERVAWEMTDLIGHLQITVPRC